MSTAEIDFSRNYMDFLYGLKRLSETGHDDYRKGCVREREYIKTFKGWYIWEKKQ